MLAVSFQADVQCVLDNRNVSGEHWQNDTDEGNTGWGEEEKGAGTYPDVTVSNTNPTWNGMESNPGLRGEIPTINCLSYSRVHTR
jgi:hypothetical protein